MPDLYLDYDHIALTYDRRYIANDMKNTRLALQELVRSTGVISVLEVGCGTGYWLAAFSTTIKHLYGLDSSAGMLSQARKRGTALMLVRGQAQNLPFQSASVDMIFTLNALHHFTDNKTFIAEAYRLLKPGCMLVILGSDPPSGITDWYIYKYFPGTYECDRMRFPARQDLIEWMSQAGFERLASRTIEHFTNQYKGYAVLDDPFLAKDSTSQLALLSDQAYAQGMQCIERDIKTAEQTGEQILFSSNIYLNMTSGWKI